MAGLIPYAGFDRHEESVAGPRRARRRRRANGATPRPKFITWPPERVGHLEQLIAEGLSYRACGRKLGCSKNAISGAVHRHLAGRVQ